MNRTNRALSLIAFLLVAVALGACGGATSTLAAATALAHTSAPAAISTPAVTASATAKPDVPFTLTSTAFVEGATIPDRYTYRMSGQCDGANISPGLTWSGTPAGTQSFAIIVADPDGGDWVHWVQFNIPGDATSLPEAEAGPDIGVKGQNDFGKTGYGGPCPPSGTHRYIFTLYALDTTLSVPEGATRLKVLTAMKDHILGTAQLTGLRSK